MAARKQAPPKAAKAPPPPPPPEPEEDDEPDLGEGYLFDLFTSFCVLGLEPDDKTGEKAADMLQLLDDHARKHFPRERGEPVEDWDERILEELDEYVALACRLLESGQPSKDAVEKAFAIITSFDEQFSDDDD